MSTHRAAASTAGGVARADTLTCSLVGLVVGGVVAALVALVGLWTHTEAWREAGGWGQVAFSLFYGPPMGLLAGWAYARVRNHVHHKSVQGIWLTLVVAFVAGALAGFTLSLVMVNLVYAPYMGGGAVAYAAYARNVRLLVLVVCVCVGLLALMAAYSTVSMGVGEKVTLVRKPQNNAVPKHAAGERWFKFKGWVAKNLDIQPHHTKRANRSRKNRGGGAS